jgi:carboxylesterase
VIVLEHSKNSLYFKKGKRAILLLHAYTGSYNDVRMLGRFLEKENYTILAPLFSGHGTNNAQDILAKDPEVWWKDTQKALSFLGTEGFKEIAVLGLSMGGVFALRALEQYDHLIGGGAFCSPLIVDRPNTIHPNFLLYAKNIWQKSQGEPLSEQMLQQLTTDSLRQLNEIEQFAKRTFENLPQIKKPVFLAQAGNDQLVDPEGIHQVVQNLKQTRYNLQWYPNSGHVITIGVDRKEFERDVLNFIDGLSWNEDKE